jgi:hypothetical protein
MRKAVKIFSALSVSLIAVAFMMGCSDGGAPEEKGGHDPLLTSSFDTYYLKLADHDLDKAINTFHFKNKTDHVLGFEIQKIFVSTGKTEDDAVVVYDFNGATDASGALSNAYWGFEAGTVADNKWSSGEVAAADATSGETYITGFASGAAYDNDAQYWGFVVKNLSDTVTGDEITIEAHNAEGIVLAKTFAEFFAK